MTYRRSRETGSASWLAGFAADGGFDSLPGHERLTGSLTRKGTDMNYLEAKEIAEDCLVGNGWGHSQGELLAAYRKLQDFSDYERAEFVSYWFTPETKEIVR